MVGVANDATVTPGCFDLQVDCSHCLASWYKSLKVLMSNLLVNCKELGMCEVDRHMHVMHSFPMVKRLTKAH